jgi:osmotically-inducible protein OsmY
MKVFNAGRTFFAIVCLATGSMVLLTDGCSTYNRTHETDSEYAVDAALSAHVSAALAATGGYKFSDVQVNTFKSRVQLSGFVDTPAHKDQAGTVAQQVDGVKEIINNIIVKRSAQILSAGR